MRIGKVARSKVVRIGNRVARMYYLARSKVVRIGNRVARIGNYRVLHIGNKVARSKVVRIGNRVAHNRVARIGNYRVLHIGNKVSRSKVVRIGNRVARIGDYRVLRAFEADISTCRALSWCQSRRRSHWLYRQRARLSL